MTNATLTPDASTLETLAGFPDDEGVVMLNLLEYTDGGEAYTRYGRNTFPLITERGGKILYAGTPLTDTREAGHWDRLILVFYPSRASFIDMMNDPRYQAGLPNRTAGLKRTVLYAFRQTPGGPALEVPTVSNDDEIFVLNLMRFKPGGGRENYEKYGAVVLPMVMERGGAAVLRLDAQLPLVADETWEDLYLVRYPRLDALQDMVATNAWQTANIDRQRGLDLTWAFPTRADRQLTR